MSGSTKLFNSYKLYVGINFCTSGNFKLNKKIKEDVSNYLDISIRTFNRNFDILLDLGLITKNHNGVYFLIGLDKLRKKFYNLTGNYEIINRYSFILYKNEIKNLKELIFTAKEALLIKNQKYTKEEQILETYFTDNPKEKDIYEKLKNKHKYKDNVIKEFYCKSAKREYKLGVPKKLCKITVIDNDLAYLGVSNSLISSTFNRSKSWGVKYKHSSERKNLLKREQVVKHHFNIKDDSQRHLISEAHPDIYHKLRFLKTSNGIGVFEQMYDRIETNIILTKRPLIF